MKKSSANKLLVCEELNTGWCDSHHAFDRLSPRNIQLICCTKMKGGLEGVVLKLFLLTIVPQLSSFEVVNETDVKEYVIGRRVGGKYDLFMLNYRNGSFCYKSFHNVNNWCNKLQADVNNTVTIEGKSCGCSCSYGFPTFLPSNQTCINENQAQRLGGKNVNHYLISFKSWTVNLNSGRNVI